MKMQKQFSYLENEEVQNISIYIQKDNTLNIFYIPFYRSSW